MLEKMDSTSPKEAVERQGKWVSEMAYIFREWKQEEMDEIAMANLKEI